MTVLMRLVFLLFAEERRLLPAEDPLWAESYSVLTLRDDLRTAAIRDGEDALERRSTAWHRLLATFRAVHGGVNHDRLSLPAYGGSLFDPDRFPFLEGRANARSPARQRLRPRPSRRCRHRPRTARRDRRPHRPGHPRRSTHCRGQVGPRPRSPNGSATRPSTSSRSATATRACSTTAAAPVDVLALGLIGPEGAEPEISITDLEAPLDRSRGAWLCACATASAGSRRVRHRQGRQRLVSTAW